MAGDSAPVFYGVVLGEFVEAETVYFGGFDDAVVAGGVGLFLVWVDAYD